MVSSLCILSTEYSSFRRARHLTFIQPLLFDAAMNLWYWFPPGKSRPLLLLEFTLPFVPVAEVPVWTPTLFPGCFKPQPLLAPLPLLVPPLPLLYLKSHQSVLLDLGISSKREKEQDKWQGYVGLHRHAKVDLHFSGLITFCFSKLKHQMVIVKINIFST